MKLFSERDLLENLSGWLPLAWKQCVKINFTLGKPRKHICKIDTRMDLVRLASGEKTCNDSRRSTARCCRVSSGRHRPKAPLRTARDSFLSSGSSPQYPTNAVSCRARFG